MPYAIKFFRDAEITRWYREHGIHDKPVGHVLGVARYPNALQAQQDADHINALYAAAHPHKKLATGPASVTRLPM